MNPYYTMIIKETLKDEINDYFKNIEKTDEENTIIQTLIDEYFEHKEIIFEDKNKKYELKESKTHIYRDRDKYISKDNMCLARIWNCGMGGQCSNKGVVDGFCRKHAEPKTGPGKHDWWLGTINNPRPERPINHKGKIHIWVK